MPAGENRERRKARRQPRGLRRVDEVLDVAARAFAAGGYAATTMNAIAAEAMMSPGSLYQFFPNKEAIAHALATRYAARLRAAYDADLTPGGAPAPLPVFLDRLIDPLVALKEDATFLALYAAAATPDRLASVARDLRDEAAGRIEAEIARRAPKMAHARRVRAARVSGHIIQAILPLTAGADATENRLMADEMKVALRRYLDPIIGVDHEA